MNRTQPEREPVRRGPARRFAVCGRCYRDIEIGVDAFIDHATGRPLQHCRCRRGPPTGPIVKGRS